MAELAGLVIGGITLAGLFDSCMNLLRTIETGQHFEADYQTAALKVVMLSARLSRWERTYRASTFRGTARDGQVAQWALEEIYKQLEAARDTGRPYLPRGDARAGDPARNVVARVTDNIKTLSLRKKSIPVKATLAAQTSWALRGKDRMDAIIANLAFFIENLENLSSPATISLSNSAIQAEAAELLEPSSLTDPETDSVPVLTAAARAVDPKLASSIEEMRARRHTYERITINDHASAINGNWVEKGAVVTGYGTDYRDVTVNGSAKTFNGDMYGGRNPTAGWFD